MTRGPAPLAWEVTFPADTACLSAVRRVVWTRLRRWGTDRETASDAVVVASELLANAVQHGSTTGDRVRFRLAVNEGQLRIAVSDASPRPPRRRQLDEEEERGRGLFLVEALATRWGVEPAGGGKRVWASLPFASVPFAPATGTYGCPATLTAVHATRQPPINAPVRKSPS
ncbi:ATP-binding protein [Streptomyces sp. N2-109]|uniref:ATP-binding protein n=1 Tax=Streptomyces gossypii TaxID=2883101 RepID=A0ABT2JRL7_9ACTN|nr:ATP-binding protein [Streptomyces gossypii]MCT2590532.1 ATP-binding protein [Streptomyces gossypii]